MSEKKSTRLTFRLSRWLLIGLAINVAAVLLFAWLAGEVLEGDTLWFDESVREWINRGSAPRLTSSMQTITFLGSGIFLLCLGALISVAFALAKWQRALVFLVITMGGATILNMTLKLSFRRIRPSSFFGTPSPSSFSFPSGHALLSLCFYCAIAYLIASRIDDPTVRWTCWVGAVLLISAIGFSRIYLGVHYPSDVIAGYAVGIFWIFTVVLLDRAISDRWIRR